MIYILYCAKNNLFLYSNQKRETQIFGFKELCVADFTEAIKKTEIESGDEVYLILSGSLYYNLNAEIPFTSIDALNKILPNLISNYHFEKNNNAVFRCIINSVSEAEKKAFISYIPENTINIFIECFRMQKLNIISTIHHAAAEFFKNSNVAIDSGKKISVVSKTENLEFILEIYAGQIVTAHTRKLETPEKNAVEEERIFFLEDIFSANGMNVLYKTFKNKKIPSFVSKNGFDEIWIKLLKNNLNKYTLYFFIIFLIVYAVYQYSIMKSLETKYSGLRDKTKTEFKKQFPGAPVIIDPLRQAKSGTDKSAELFEFYLSSSGMAFDYNKLLNELFVILNKHNVTINILSMKKNIISFSGEAQSIGELDKIKLEAVNHISSIVEFKILNSRYKNIINNTGAEFDAEIILKN